MELPEDINNVVKFFSRLPGVGEKTATRQTLMLTGWSAEELEAFGRVIGAISKVKKCKKCFFFSEGDICSICSNPERLVVGQLCVVESETDMLAVENSGRYCGSYHILGGVLAPLLGIGPKELRIGEMLTRIEQEGIKNIIVAVNPSVEGDATASYIREVVPKDVAVERIGFGIPIGGCLEYLDSMTISKALENKKRI